MIIREVKGDTFAIKCYENGDLVIADNEGVTIMLNPNQVHELQELLQHVWSANGMYQFIREENERVYGIDTMGLTPVDRD